MLIRVLGNIKLFTHCSRSLSLTMLVCMIMGGLYAQMEHYVVYQEESGTLQLCNNIILNNVSPEVTNVSSVPTNNLTGENTAVLTDNHLDFSIKPGSAAVNAGDGNCALWLRDLRDRARVQSSRIDMGAFELIVDTDVTRYTLLQCDNGSLQLCNNLVLNNVAHELTNISSVSANNLTGENTAVFTDNHLDFSVKPSSVAINAGDDDCADWNRGMFGLNRHWENIDIGAYEMKNIVGNAYTVQQDEEGTLLLYNNIVMGNVGIRGNTDVIADSSINLLYDADNVFAGSGDYHLIESSPAANAGDNQYVNFSFDLDGEIRRACEGIVDQGAFELQAIHEVLLVDIVCGEGQPYHRYGFDIDSVPAGETTYVRSVVSGLLCDSVISLSLFVVDPLQATMVASADTICAGESVSLWVMQDHAVPMVAVGDILCTDGSLVKPSAWPVTGKTAMGIVFYVDSTGEHGWAVHIQEQGNSVRWTPSGSVEDIPDLANYTYARDAITDLDGYTNTQLIRAAGNATTYPAAYAVDFANGWYLPAAGQLRLISAETVVLNASLQIVGGTQFPMNESGKYWSSTESDQNKTWYLNYRGYMISYNKYNGVKVRSVRAF